MRFRTQTALFVLILTIDVCLGARLFFVWRDRSDASLTVSAGETPVEPKVVALTFDDGPNAKYTGALLDGLKERGVRVSFFLLGDCIEGNEALVRRMDEEGHLIGVHGLHHADLTKEKLSVALGEIEETKARILALTGKVPQYVRPPYGSWNEALREEIPMEPVFWSVDSVDWKLQNTAGIVKKVLKNTKNGDIILMHDEFPTSVEAALEIVDRLLADGYSFVTVDELSID
ncbi:MAG: polysaccharide deacetylase family protein [Lachnospiraceae bacterium]|jgi:peptidoglycan/xylan/chitin deacetylase (PgdA/CDA1 family)|nr:polysaccharide deacetylase family protein [Lachnospiraceae bacterium]